MAKFYKPGRVVVVSNGRFAGKKGIIIRSNFEQTKTRKYPHCLVIGLTKPPRRVTKKWLKKQEELAARPVKMSKNGRRTKGPRELKKLGVFTKTYNMNHIIATRYKISENFGIDKAMKVLDQTEQDIKDLTSTLNSKSTSSDAKDKEECKKLQTEIGANKDKLKKQIGELKTQVGTELFNRYMKGFQKTSNSAENENIANSEFLFAKLKF